MASLPLGILVAWVMARREFPGKLMVEVLIHLPLVMPPVVTGYLLLMAFGRQGPLGDWLENTLGFSFAFNWTGAALACGIMGFPLLVRSVRLSIESIDRGLEQAAMTLGANPTRVLVRITLPLALPGILAGAVLCFAKALGEFGATITFVSNIPGLTQTLPGAIYNSIQLPEGEASALRLTGVAIALSVVALLASEWLARRVRQRHGRAR